MPLSKLPASTADQLRKAGLKVVEIDGWQNRASAGGASYVGVLNHHTGAHDGIGDPENDLAYAKWMFLQGRSDLDPPLCNIALSAEGVVYIGASGNANHGGIARASGSVAAGDANRLYVGIEWMLSGTQPIPKAMYEAAAILNAVLLEILGSSVQAVSCHYQTSVTGKWDIGDPNGIAFGSARVLDVPKFRLAVKKARKALNPPKPDPKFEIVTFQHTSMQFSDTDSQMARDVERIFGRGRQVLTGTEAGGEKAKPLPDLLREAAEDIGYHYHQAKGEWIAVSRELTKKRSRVTRGYVPVLESHEGLGKHTDRGIAWMSFNTDNLGKITIGAGHYLTHGRKPGDPNWTLNQRYADAIGEWARDKGRGQDLVFYGGDQNIPDRTEDTFFGSPLTSAWDEIGRYENTGHGNIDLVASYDRDGRVEAKGIRALDDRELHLFTDHFLVEAEYKIAVL